MHRSKEIAALTQVEAGGVEGGARRAQDLGRQRDEVRLVARHHGRVRTDEQRPRHIRVDGEPVQLLAHRPEGGVGAWAALVPDGEPQEGGTGVAGLPAAAARVAEVLQKRHGAFRIVGVQTVKHLGADGCREVAERLPVLARKARPVCRLRVVRRIEARWVAALR